MGDVSKSDVDPETEFYEHRGICGFDFNNRTVSSDNGRKKRINLSELFMHLRLWHPSPGRNFGLDGDLS